MKTMKVLDSKNTFMITINLEGLANWNKMKKIFFKYQKDLESVQGKMNAILSFLQTIVLKIFIWRQIGLKSNSKETGLITFFLKK